MQQVDNGLLNDEQQRYLQTVTTNFKNSLAGKIDMISINKQPNIDELLDGMKPYGIPGSIIIIDNL